MTPADTHARSINIAERGLLRKPDPRKKMLLGRWWTDATLSLESTVVCQRNILFIAFKRYIDGWAGYMAHLFPAFTTAI